ncbi:VOC family protein [Acaricomes phytoseiuli]|uniref:VOC family protein n=1 Tax=Acaricomes phytoseiuli TaxID=291968 RepID=UPI0003A8DC97|nr:VOC family protein [Acaricomes phytoseiuli]MCW1249342.1 VOC family protein [Acaricomes phytoseiuli]
MTIRLNPYLHFDGTARDAMTFYQSIFGGSLEIRVFADLELNETQEDADKVMHSLLETENGMTLMGGDVPSSVEVSPNGSITLSGVAADEERLRGYWEKLSEGGIPFVPLSQAPWGDSFGMCRDRFGVSWMVNIAGA